MQIDPRAIPLQAIKDAVTEKHGIHLFVLRTDLNHPEISGNKLFKLKYNLKQAKEQGKGTLLTFGGAYSNHIAATAAAGKESGFHTIGIIRGDELPELNPTLRFAKECGMELHYVSRSLFQNKEELFSHVKNNFPSDVYIIPEGGSNELGVKGCQEITGHISVDFDTICCACGTGTTLAGITLSLKKHQTALGFQILKAENYIANEIKRWMIHFNSANHHWSINEDYHFGGYAKLKPELTSFTQNFEKDHGIQLDMIYTGKMMFGIYDLMEKNYFKPGETVIAVHTGGLQGNAGFIKLT